MNTAENTTEQTSQNFTKGSCEQDKLQTPSMDCTQPYALSLVGMESSVTSINESTTQIKELIKSLDTQKNPKNHELIIRGIKETRELLKLKLELGKFAHVVGGRRTGKAKKETA